MNKQVEYEVASQFVSVLYSYFSWKIERCIDFARDFDINSRVTVLDEQKQLLNRYYSIEKSIYQAIVIELGLTELKETANARTSSAIKDFRESLDYERAKSRHAILLMRNFFDINEIMDNGPKVNIGEYDLRSLQLVVSKLYRNPKYEQLQLQIDNLYQYKNDLQRFAQAHIDIIESEQEIATAYWKIEKLRKRIFSKEALSYVAYSSQVEAISQQYFKTSTNLSDRLSSAYFSRMSQASKIYYYLNDFEKEQSDNPNHLWNPPFESCKNKLNDIVQSGNFQRPTFAFSRNRDVLRKYIADQPSVIFYEGKMQKQQGRKNFLIHQCTDYLMGLHEASLLTANYVYNIVFSSTGVSDALTYTLPNDKIITDYYEIKKIYGHSPAQCQDVGFKGILLASKKLTDVNVFAIAGTEFETDSRVQGNWFMTQYSKLRDTFSDLVFGMSQLRSACAQQMINDAKALIVEGKDVVFTGHSLGGGLSQSIAYLTEKSVQEQNSTTNRGQVYMVSWNGFGTKEMIDLYSCVEPQSHITREIYGVAYFNANDFVSKLGNHIYETRRLPNKFDHGWLRNFKEHVLTSIEQNVMNDDFAMLDRSYVSTPETDNTFYKVSVWWAGFLSRFSRSEQCD
jgi:hypothetical protein